MVHNLCLYLENKSSLLFLALKQHVNDRLGCWYIHSVPKCTIMLSKKGNQEKVKGKKKHVSSLQKL